MGGRAVAKATAAVVGATGYAGAELVRLLHQHPRVELLAVTAREPGRPLTDSYPHLLPAGDLLLEEAEAAGRADVVFLALPHGLAGKLAPSFLERGCRVVDLGADFRLSEPAVYARWYGTEHPAPEALRGAVYGLPELFRAEIRGAGLVANPGCYPTAAALALAPFLAAGTVAPRGVVVDAKSGVSGAGRSVSLGVHFGEVNENLRPYSLAGRHRHTPEIEQTLGRVAGTEVRVSFNPHLVPMTRGILCTAYAPLEGSLGGGDAQAIQRDFYRGEPWVHVLQEGRWPETKMCLGSNNCFVAASVDERAGLLVAVAALDNLVKGAAGQAVQNMNLMLGWEETLGLPRLALYP